MKAKVKIAVLVWILCLSGKCLLAQNYAQDMDKIEQKCKQGDFSFHVKYLFYPYDSLHKASDSMNAFCSQSNGQYYCKISASNKEYEYVKNSKFFFVVDHAEKAIAVKKNTDAQQQMWDISHIDSVVKTTSIKITYKDIGHNEGEYSINLKKGVWTGIRLIFNKSTYTVDKMYMTSKRKGKMYGREYKNPEIAVFYSNYSIAPAVKSVFQESTFFSETTSGVLTLSDSYKSYKLLNYLQKRS